MIYFVLQEAAGSKQSSTTAFPMAASKGIAEIFSEKQNKRKHALQLSLEKTALKERRKPGGKENIKMMQLSQHPCIVESMRKGISNNYRADDELMRF